MAATEAIQQLAGVSFGTRILGLSSNPMPEVLAARAWWKAHKDEWPQRNVTNDDGVEFCTLVSYCHLCKIESMSTAAANYPPYIRSEKIDLKAHAVLNEKWLQARLAEDPSLLGLGADLKLEGKEHTVPSGGKLDLLFKDSDSVRYAVEVQLGAIDPSHIIRTIEYWLSLKPKCVPVLVAENFNVRFKNVVER